MWEQKEGADFIEGGRGREGGVVHLYCIQGGDRRHKSGKAGVEGDIEAL